MRSLYEDHDVSMPGLRYGCDPHAGGTALLAISLTVIGYPAKALPEQLR